VPLGIWLALDGLWLRLFGVGIVEEGIAAWWQWLPATLGIAAAEWGWPMIVVGTAWFSVIFGLWMRLGWSKRAAIALALASLLHLGIGTVIAVIALGCLVERRLTSWLETSPG
jgi:hypothetical protein